MNIWSLPAIIFGKEIDKSIKDDLSVLYGDVYKKTDKVMHMIDYGNLKWKELFAARILNRGYDYYLDGNVWDLRDDDGRVSATVAGTEDYSVIITLANGKVTDMDCDCPYAADGNYCKHEAAVLYALTEGAKDNEEEEEPGKTKPSCLSTLDAEREELRQYISCMSEDEMRDMLYQLACNDESLKNRIAAMYSNDIDEKLILKMRKMVDNIEFEHSDRFGFIDWRHASDFIGDLIEFLYDNVEPLIDRGMLEEAFELTCHVFLTIGNADIDDDGDIVIGTEECREYWNKIVQKSSDAQQEKMYDWFSDHIGNGSVYDYMEDDLEEFRMTGFHSKRLLNKRLEELDEIINIEVEDYRNNKDRWRSYRLIRNIDNRIDTMTELEMPRTEVLSYMEKYSFLPEILIRYAGAVYEDHNSDYAIGLLKKGKVRDADNFFAVNAYSHKLIEFYASQEMKNELVKELSFQVMNCYQQDLNFINRLKELISDEEWLAKREDILASETCSTVRLDLMQKEKLYDRLMKEIIRSGSISTLDRYEKDLRSEYQCEIRDMYADYVRETVGKTSNRKQYQYLVNELRKVRRYDGGKELAESIAASWKQKYKRRPALMDELRKAGF